MIDLHVRLLHLAHDLAMSVWFGGLVYTCWILPPMRDTESVPPPMIRIMGLRRFCSINMVALILLFTDDTVAWSLRPMQSFGLLAVQVLPYLGGMVSALQLNHFLGRTSNTAYLRDCGSEAADRLMRQISKVLHALLYFAIAALAVTDVFV